MAEPVSGSEDLVLPSEFDVLEKVDAATLRHTRIAGFDEELATMVAIAVIEAVTNAVIHGNHLDLSKVVKMRYEASPGCLRVSVQDEGEGFDLDCVCDPMDPDRRLSFSGRGIYIMRQVMDSVEFEMEAGKGTTVVLEKRV